jgi:NADH:ubiquinone oxidoreductase subunit 6 (subunit J)
MLTALCIGLGVALASAFGAIALGRNLTRSLLAGTVSFFSLGFALLVAGAGVGFVSLVVVISGALTLSIFKVFGWMLVDMDRDHLPATDRPTRVARSLAFFLFGGGLIILVAAALMTGEFASVEQRVEIAGPAEIGMLLFGPLRAAAILMGLAIAASLLGALLLLQDDGQKG